MHDEKNGINRSSSSFPILIMMTMEPSSCYPIVLLIIILLLPTLINQIAKRFQNLPPIPPLCLPIIGHLHLMKKPQIYSQLAEKYGPIVLLYFGFRPVLLVSSPTMVEECLNKNDVIFANRPKFLTGKYLGYDYTTLIWASYGPHWRNLKKIATIEILSSSRIQMFAHVRAGEVRSMMRQLATAAKGGDGFSSVDMKSVFFELTLNTIMRMIAGKRYYGKEAQKTEEARRFREIIKESNLVNLATNLGDFIPLSRWIGGQIKLERMLKRLHSSRDRFMQDLIDEKRRTVSRSDFEDKDKCLIDILLSLQKNEPEYYKDEIIRGMIQVLLIGASENPAITMEWALTLLLNHPNALKKAQIEIQNHMMNNSNRLINDSDLNHLPYLQAIIDETLRLYPPGNLLGHHESSEKCVIGGYTIPRGTVLFVNLRAMHIDPEIWEEPNEFRPERFLNVEKEKIKFEYLPFSLGRRGCPGEAAAKRMIGLALGSLIQCFDWARAGEELVDMTEGPGLNLGRAHPLLVKCRPRPEMVKLLLAESEEGC